MSQAKPFSISKKIVWEAYERVKANKGAAGVDSESIEVFEQDLKNNLYKIWNRMSSGTYFPPPVRTVAIPKKDGGERRLGIPTVAEQDCSNGGQTVSGALGGTVLPSRLLRLSASQVRARCRGQHAAAVLAVCLGH